MKREFEWNFIYANNQKFILYANAIHSYNSLFFSLCLFRSIDCSSSHFTFNHFSFSIFSNWLGKLFETSMYSKLSLSQLKFFFFNQKKKRKSEDLIGLGSAGFERKSKDCSFSTWSTEHWIEKKKYYSHVLHLLIKSWNWLNIRNALTTNIIRRYQWKASFTILLYSFRDRWTIFLLYDKSHWNWWDSTEWIETSSWCNRLISGSSFVLWIYHCSNWSIFSVIIRVKMNECETYNKFLFYFFPNWRSLTTWLFISCYMFDLKIGLMKLFMVHHAIKVIQFDLKYFFDENTWQNT